MNNHNPRGTSAPIEDWSHDDLVAFMAWEIIRGLTSGDPIRSIVYQFPHICHEWQLAKKAKK